MTETISLQLARNLLLYLSSADVIGLYRLILDLVTANVLRAHTTGGKVFDLAKKRRGEKILRRNVFITLITRPVSFVTCCKKVQSAWIARDTVV